MTASPNRTSFFTFVVVALITLVTLGCESMNRAEAIRTMNRGFEALDAGQTIDAIRFLKEAGTIDPSFPDPPYYIGQIYHRKLNQLSDAETSYRDALSRAEDNPQIAYQLGTVLADQEKWQDSIAFFRKAVDAKPDFAKAWFRLGISYEMDKAYPEAIEALMKSIEADARLTMTEDDAGGEHYHALGDLYNRFGFYDKALKVYENGVANNGDVARLLGGQGVAQLQLQRYDEARDSFTKALKADPSLNTALFNLAVADLKTGSMDSAMQRFELFNSRADPSQDEARIIAAQGFIQQIIEAKEKAEGGK